VAGELGTVAEKLAGEKRTADGGWRIVRWRAQRDVTWERSDYHLSPIRYPLPSASAATLTDRPPSVIWMTLLRVVFMGTCTPRPEPFAA